MKRTFITLSLALALIIVSTTAVALAHDEQNDTATRTKPFLLKEERRIQFQETMEERRGAFETRMEEFRKERIASMIGSMKRRFEGAIERLTGIADRIDARIAKIEAETESDLSDASSLVLEARERIDDAADLIDEVSTSSAASLFDNASTTGNRFGMLRDLFADAKTKLQEARELLSQAVRVIGQSRGNATTTSSN